MMAEWLDALGQFDRDGRPAVLVTVLSARGSTPREAGAKMVVTEDTLHGTIGGGNLEFQCQLIARDMLAGIATAPVSHDFPLGPALGQCCGGHASVLFEPIRPPSWKIALFGAGHVGRALVRLLGTLPCRVTWIDPRADAFPAEHPANVRVVVADSVADRIAALAPATTVLVMTHDHALDFDIVAAALARDDLASVCLIGSATKRVRFVRRLAQRGLAPSAIERLVCPIGVPGAGGKLPAEIAVAVAAQLLQIRDGMHVTDTTTAPTTVAATPRAALKLVPHPVLLPQPIGERGACGALGCDCSTHSKVEAAS